MGPPLPGAAIRTMAGTGVFAAFLSLGAGPAAAQANPRDLFVPVVLRNQYSSEITFTNRGTTSSLVSLRYTAASGGGSGVVQFPVEKGQQLVVPDAIAFLRDLGLPIAADGLRIGTLHAIFGGLSSFDVAAVTVRTGTDVAQPAGRAGLAYPGLSPDRTLSGTAWLVGLRFGTATDRTNIALQHAGFSNDGPVTLRVSIYNRGGGGVFRAPPDVTLQPGGFLQFSSTDLGLPEDFVGSAKVERISGKARFYAYAVVNDQTNSDGSFLAPVSVDTLTAGVVTLPSVVESGAFRTEVILSNLAADFRRCRIHFACAACPGGEVSYLQSIGPGTVLLYPDFVAELRRLGFALPQPVGVGVLTLTEEPPDGSTLGLYLAARTSAVVPGHGKFGVFYPAARPDGGAIEAWVDGLQQNATNRSNLAFIALRGVDDDPITLEVDLFDGESGSPAGIFTVDGLVPNSFQQVNSVLAVYAPGHKNVYARVRRTSGRNPFLAYGVVNDGAVPGERTGDGAFLAMDVTDNGQ